MIKRESVGRENEGEKYRFHKKKKKNKGQGHWRKEWESWRPWRSIHLSFPHLLKAYYPHLPPHENQCELLWSLLAILITFHPFDCPSFTLILFFFFGLFSLSIFTHQHISNIFSHSFVFFHNCLLVVFSLGQSLSLSLCLFSDHNLLRWMIM